MNTIAQKLFKLLRWSEKYTNTDMVYLARGGFWLLIGKGGLFIITFFIMFAFGNWLPRETYGTYAYILSIMGLLSVFSLPGINISLIKSVAQKKEGSLGLAVKTRLKWGLLGTIGMFLAAGWYLFHDQQLLATALFIGGIFLPPYSAFSLFGAYWNGKQQFDTKSKYEIGASSITALFLISVIYLTNNLLIILAIFLISQVISQGFFLWITIKRTENKEEEKETIRFGKSLTLIGAIPVITQQIDKIILWNFLGPVQLAIYVFASQPIQKIMLLNPMGPLALPKLSSKGVRRNLLNKFFLSFALTIPVALILSLATPFAFKILFPQYLDSVIYFQALSILIALMPISLLYNALIAKTEEKQLYVVNVARSSVKIVLYLILVPPLGIWGVIIGQIAGEIAWSITIFYFFMKITSRKEV